MKFFVQSQSTGTKIYDSSFIKVKYYADATKFRYRLVNSNGDTVFKSQGRKTELVFQFANKMKIYAKNKVNVEYSLEFELALPAKVIAHRIISASYTRNEVSLPLYVIVSQLTREPYEPDAL